MTTTVTASCLCIRRTGDVVPFNADKIALAMRKAFIAVQGESPDSRAVCVMKSPG